MNTLPLDGVVVVALEQAVAAPFATRQLGDLGARVIKIERPGTGDFARAYDETVHGQSSHFVWLNRNRESIERAHANHGGIRRPPPVPGQGSLAACGHPCWRGECAAASHRAAEP